MAEARRVTGTVQVWPASGTQYHRAGSVFYSLLAHQQAHAKLAVFFPGDNVEGAHSAEVDRLSRPETIATSLVDKLGPATGVFVVYPSRYEGPFACYDNLFPASELDSATGPGSGPGARQRLTASGEPMGYHPRGLSTTKALLRHLRAAWRSVSGLESQICTPLPLKDEGPGNATPPPHPCCHPVPLTSSHGLGGLELESPSSPGHQSVPHLEQTTCSDPAPAGRQEVVLCGFSKGGVVLNQIFCEFAFHSTVRAEGQGRETDSEAETARLRGSEAETGQPVFLLSPKGEPSTAADNGSCSTAAEAFLGAVSEMHYIDVGLNCRGAYPCDAASVSQFVQFCSVTGGKGSRPRRIVLHGTPRQWNDRRRQWIAQEKALFEQLLAQGGAVVRKWRLNHEGKTVEAVPVLEDTSQAPLPGVTHITPPVCIRAQRTQKQPSEQSRHGLIVDEVKYFEQARPSMEMHFQVLDAMAMGMLPG